MNYYNDTKWSEKNVDIVLNALVQVFAYLCNFFIKILKISKGILLAHCFYKNLYFHFYRHYVRSSRLEKKVLAIGFSVLVV